VISAEGKVIPRDYLNLGFSLTGVVQEVLVKEGDSVRAGQLLAELKGRQELEAARTAAQLELLAAEQDLQALYDHNDLAKAEAQQAVLDAQEAVRSAERVRASLDSKPSQSQIDVARSAVLAAEKVLERAREQLSQYSNRPEDNPQRIAAQLAVYAAERELGYATRYYNALTGEPNETTIDQAEASLALAQAQEAEAEKRFATLQNGPDPDQVALAQSRVDNAKAQTAAVESNLEELKLRAPFDGQVVRLDLKAGQLVNPSLPQVLLADLSAWQVETTDLSENDIALIGLNMPATITLNAFPEQPITGRVRAVKQLGQESRGLITYVVIIDLDPSELPLLWEMTAFVDFQLGE
jgi:multidrug resistance efflux pump